MKFGKTLHKELIPEWEEKYLDYQMLKTRLKDMGSPLTGKSSTDNHLSQEELSFIKAAERELQKVSNFYDENEIKLAEKYLLIFEEIQIFLIHDEQQKKLMPFSFPESCAFTPSQSSKFKEQVLRICKTNFHCQRQKEAKYFELHGGWREENGSARSSEEKRRVKNSIKKALLEYYRHLQLLKEFKELNLNGFVKILKKFDKYRSLEISSYFRSLVQQKNIASSKTIETLMKNVEQLTKIALCDGDRHSTMQMLRLKDERHRTEYSNCSFANFFGGISICITFYCLYHLSNLEERAFKGIAAIFSIILLFWSYGLNCIIWNAYNVNYRFIFGFDLRNCISPYKYLLLVSLISLAFSIHLLVIFAFPKLTLYFGMISLIFLMFLMLGICLVGRKFRFWMPKTLGRVFFPFFKVLYGDFFVADQLTSILIAFEALPSMLICPFSKNYRKTEIFLGSILICLPYLIRLLQCLRRFYDGKVWYPHMVSFCKYFINLSFYVTLCYFKSTSPSTSHFPYKGIIIIPFCIASTLFNSFWDSYYDFGLFHRATLKNSNRKMIVFREKYIYPSKFVHFFIFAANIIFRFAWILKIAHPKSPAISNQQMIFLVFLECLRRFFWNLIRMENEQISNCGLFRAVLEIPLPSESSFLDQETPEQEESPLEEPQKELENEKEEQTDNFSINFSVIKSMSQSFPPPASPSIETAQI